MKIEGHRFRDRVRLLTPLFVLIAAVWALRLVAFAAGAEPGSVTLHIISVTVTGAASILLAVLMIHHRRFGSYPSVVAAVFFLIAWEELLISAAIAFASITGTVNVYSVAKYSFGRAPWHHIAAQLTLILGSRTILGAAMGCLLLWMLRRVDPMEGQRATSGRQKAVGNRY